MFEERKVSYTSFRKDNTFKEFDNYEDALKFMIETTDEKEVVNKNYRVEQLSIFDF